MPLTPGTRLGPYEVVGPIGAGGMGEVYRARDAKLNRFVALKVLHGHFAADPDRLARFEREAQAVAALSHPGILAIHDFGSAGGVTYAVMELLEGGGWTVERASPCLPNRSVDWSANVVEGTPSSASRGHPSVTSISHARRTIVPAYVLTAVVQSLRRGRDQVRRW